MNALLTFSEGIFCKGEALGQSFHATISGVDVCIHFPRLPSTWETGAIGVDSFLRPPEIAEKWRHAEGTISWGYSRRYPRGESFVTSLAIDFNCDELTREEQSSALLSGIKAWGKAFIDYLIISTKQYSKRDKNKINGAKCDLEFFENEWPSEIAADAIYVYVLDPDLFASKKQIEEALQYAGSGQELFLEYQMMLSAYEARRFCRNRQAIIDACAAVELCLDNSIGERLRTLDLNPKLFIDKFRSLGDKFDLIKQLDKAFPEDDHQGIVVRSRNAIAHNRETYPSDEITDRLISCVEDCLEHFHSTYY